MVNADDSNVLVFFLLQAEPGVGAAASDFFAAEMTELVLDEQTPRFVCQHLTANDLHVSEPLLLKVCAKDWFLEDSLRALKHDTAGRLAVELRLLEQWLVSSHLPTVAYQWKLGVPALEPWRRPDDSVTYWEDLDTGRRDQVLASDEISAAIVDWAAWGKPLAIAEDELFNALLGATTEVLPFYEYVFRGIVTGRLRLSGSADLLRYRVCDRAVKMFIRFPTYLSRQFLRRSQSQDGRIRAAYLELLATAFQYNVAPLPLDRFCDYLSAKADCHGQERADLAWFVGELSILGRPRQAIGLDGAHGGWLRTDAVGLP